MAKDKKMKKFKKAIEGSIVSIQKMFKNKNQYDGAILLAKKGEAGVTFIEGSAGCIAVMLKESCERDEGFKNILIKVVDDILREDGKEESFLDMLKESGIELPKGAVVMPLGDLKEPTDEQVDKFVDQMLKDIKKKRDNGEI